jgi:DNA-binding NarL/FixJ family response regulator
VHEQPGAFRAVLVDDHRLLAQSLALALGLEGVSCTVPDLGDPVALLAGIQADAPDLVLLDLDLGGAIGDGSTLVAPLVASGCRVLVVSASADRELVGRALERGAVGVVNKCVAFDALLDAVLAALRGQVVMDEADRHRLLSEVRAGRAHRAEITARFARLTAREAQVLSALSEGCSVSSIAARSFVSEATVRSQVRGVLTKLGVTSQLEAVALAHRSGWRDGEHDWRPRVEPERSAGATTSTRRLAG